MRTNHHTAPGRISVYADVADAIVELDEVMQPDPQTVTAERTAQRRHADALHALGDLYERASGLPVETFDSYLMHNVKAQNDADGIAEVQRIAALLGVQVRNYRGTHTAEWRHPSGAVFTAYFRDAECRASLARKSAERAAETAGA